MFVGQSMGMCVSAGFGAVSLHKNEEAVASCAGSGQYAGAGLPLITQASELALAESGCEVVEFHAALRKDRPFILGEVGLKPHR